MNVDIAVDMGREAILLTLLVGAPIMLMAIAVGLTISILQAVTQIQDQTIALIPKIVAMMMMLFRVMPWIVNQMIDYVEGIYANIPGTL
ncbi:MAG: flagellar biosynthetic protein FliQ [Planctomycetaceae bacterium]|nr:flagellar biosynthetic protein FliQ [Planctomycetaceae bacterium]